MGWIRQQAETPVLIQSFLYSAYRSRQAVLAGNLLTDQIRPIYFKYLAAFGSVLISSIYGVVDAAMVGQYQGPTDKTAAVFGIVWTLAAELVPNGFVRIFITPTDSILSIAPGIIRRYGISFLLPFNIFSTYYFQAMMKPSTAFVVSVSRGAVRSSRSGNCRTHIQTYFSRAVKSGALRKQTGHPNRPGRFRSSRCQLIELSAAAAMYR